MPNHLIPFSHSKKDDFISKFVDALEHIKTSLIAGEGRLPPKQKEIFITKGMKFLFEFRAPPKGETTEIYLLMHILGEHLAELCSHLSFVKLSTQFIPSKLSGKLNRPGEQYFNQKIYLGKRNF